MERERLNVGLNYRVLPLLQLKGYYELQYRDWGCLDGKLDIAIRAGFIVSGTKRNIKLGWRELCNIHLLVEQMSAITFTF